MHMGVAINTRARVGIRGLKATMQSKDGIYNVSFSGWRSLTFCQVDRIKFVPVDEEYSY